MKMVGAAAKSERQSVALGKVEHWLLPNLEFQGAWEEADVIFIAANFSQMCAVGKEWSARRFFNRILKSADGPWRSASMARVPKVVSLQYRQNCRLPWADPAGGPPKLPRDTLVLTDQLNCKSPDLGHRRHCCGCETSNELTAPFAITTSR